MDRNAAVRKLLALGAVVAAVKPGAKNPLTKARKVPGGWRAHQREGHLAEGLDHLLGKHGDGLDEYLLPGSMHRPSSGLVAVCADCDKPGAADAVVRTLGNVAPFVRCENPDPEKAGREHLWYWVDEAASPSGNIYVDGVHVGEWRAMSADRSTEGCGMRLYPGECEQVARAFAHAVHFDSNTSDAHSFCDCFADCEGMTDREVCACPGSHAEPDLLTELRARPWTAPVAKACGALRGLPVGDATRGCWPS